MTTFLGKYLISCQLLCNEHSELFILYISINFTLTVKILKDPRESKENEHTKRNLYSHRKEKYKSKKNQNELQICESLQKTNNQLSIICMNMLANNG